MSDQYFNLNAVNYTQESPFLEVNLKIRNLLKTAYEKADKESGYKNYWALFSSIHEITVILNEIFGYFNKLNLEISEPFLQALQEANFGNLKIIRRLLDNNFYLGIIGEFSCGKSTFINAFLERQSLIEDVLPGTTCSVTKIKYASHENLTAFFNDGSKEILRHACNADIFLPEKDKQKFLELMTATEENARNIKEVIWEAPIDTLKLNTEAEERIKACICLIDTPGLGSLNERHTGITRQIAKECDGLAVLTGLDKPLSNELLTDVKEIINNDKSLEENAEKLYFIGTKKDLLPEKELERMTRHFAKRLKAAFGTDCPFTFVSAYQASQNKNAYYQEFCEFRHNIRELLKQNRAFLQLKNVVSLLTRTIKKISLEFKQQQKNFEGKITAWQKDVLISQPDFWEECDRKLSIQYSNAAYNIYINARAQADELVNRMQTEIKNGIYACSSNDAIKNFLKYNLEPIRVKYIEELSGLLETDLVEPFRQTVKQLQSGFLDTIQSEYKKAEALFSALITVKTELTPMEDRNRPARLSHMGYLAERMDFEDYKIMGSGFAGAIAAALFVPGLGWLLAGVGGILGVLAGIFFSKSLNEWKNEIYGEVSKKFQTFKNDLHENLQKAYTRLGKSGAECLENFIDSRRAKYEEIIEAHNQNIAKRQTMLNDANNFLNMKIERLKKIGDDLNTLTLKYKN